MKCTSISSEDVCAKFPQKSSFLKENQKQSSVAKTFKTQRRECLLIRWKHTKDQDKGSIQSRCNLETQRREQGGEKARLEGGLCREQVFL